MAISASATQVSATFSICFSETHAAAGGRHTGPQRGNDLRYDLQITLEEAFSGTSRDISFEHIGQCETCHGSGAEPGTLVVACDRCGGTGVARVVRNTPLGQMVTQAACPKCRGEGHFIEHPCHGCGGAGRRQMERHLTVQVPAGVDEGSRIRIAGNGEAGTNGGPSGDLYVYLNVARHRMFRREGANTRVDVTIGFAQAALGAMIAAPSLDGEVEVEYRRVRSRERRCASAAAACRRCEVRNAAIISSPSKFPSRPSSLDGNENCSKNTRAKKVTPSKSVRSSIASRTRSGPSNARAPILRCRNARGCLFWFSCVDLDGSDLHKVTNVLRLRAGDTLEIVDSSGTMFGAAFAADGGRLRAETHCVSSRQRPRKRSASMSPKPFPRVPKWTT